VVAPYADCLALLRRRDAQLDEIRATGNDARPFLFGTRSATLHDEEVRCRANIVLRGLESLMVSIES